MQVPCDKLWLPDIVLYNRCQHTTWLALNNDVKHYPTPRVEYKWALMILMPFSADDYSMEYYRALAVVESNGLVFWSPPTKFRSTCPVSAFKLTFQYF